ncbi:Ig-like domain-containing protein [Stappia sp.]|uniref:LysM peptidoglycan-binding domain-containing protein n=1 Tax=Stappia sp. TaxID=1870903 RepID=UPI003D0A5D4A
MTRKLVIQLLVLAGVVGAGGLGYMFWQRANMTPGETAQAPGGEAPAAGSTAQTAAPAQTGNGEAAEGQPSEGQTPEGQTPEGQTTADAAKVPSFDLMRVEKDGSAVVAGQSEAGAIVALLSNGKVVGKGIANASGEFAIVLDEPLPPGAHAVTLETRDQSGATLGASTQSMAVSVPETPEGDVLVMLNEPGAPSQVLQKPQIADVGAPAGDAAGGGTSQGDGATVVADAGPNAGGDAQSSAPTTNPAQDSSAAAGGSDPAGTVQAGAPATDTQTAGAPATDTPATDTPATDTQTADAPAGGTEPAGTQPGSNPAGGETAGSAPASGTTATQTANAGAQDRPATSGEAAAGAAATATGSDTSSPANAPSTPAAGQTADSATAPVTVEAVETEKDKVFVAGAGEPNSDVRVYVDNKLVGEAKTDAGGRWLLETQGEVKPGEVAVRADQVKPGDGAVVARAEVTFEKEADAVVLRPVALSGTAGAGSGDSASTGTRAIPSIIIRTGDNLWTISQRRYGEGVRYTTIYQANKDQIRNPDLIYPGQVFMMPEGDRNWPAAPSSGG